MVLTTSELAGLLAPKSSRIHSFPTKREWISWTAPCIQWRDRVVSRFRAQLPYSSPSALAQRRHQLGYALVVISILHCPSISSPSPGHTRKVTGKGDYFELSRLPRCAEKIHPYQKRSTGSQTGQGAQPQPAPF